MFQHMMEMKEKTKKSSIVMYEKAVVGSDRGLSNLLSDVRELCDQCQIDHLESIGAFVLQYTRYVLKGIQQVWPLPQICSVCFLRFKDTVKCATPGAQVTVQTHFFPEILDCKKH